VEHPALKIDISVTGDSATVAVAGEIDLYTAAGLQAEADRALERPVAQLFLDLADVTFCDSQGLAVLVWIDRKARAQGSHLTIVNPTRIVTRVMQITGLDTTLDVLHGDSDKPAEAPADGG
jgi:anti-sigma B factor antagonist